MEVGDGGHEGATPLLEDRAEQCQKKRGHVTALTVPRQCWGISAPSVMAQLLELPGGRVFSQEVMLRLLGLRLIELLEKAPQSLGQSKWVCYWRLHSGSG